MRKERITAAATTSWSIIESRGRPGLEGLEDDWRRLYAQIPLRTSFLAYEAALARLERLPSPNELRWLALTKAQQIRAICPLEPSERWILRRHQKTWQVLWHDHGRQANVLCPDDEAARRLVPALVAHLRGRREGRHILVLGPMPASSPVWKGLRDIPRSGYCAETRESVWLLDCSRPFNELRASLPRHFRHKLNTAGRKLRQLDDVRFTTVTRPDEIEAAFDTFLEIEASGWKGEDGTRSALRYRDGQRAVFRSLVANLRGEADHCEITSLYAEGRCLASQFSTRTGGTYSALKIGRDESCRRVSPGQLLLEKIVERCCADPGIQKLDLVSDAAWVRGWRPQAVPLQLAYVVLSPQPVYPFTAALLRLRYGPARRLARRLRGGSSAVAAASDGSRV